LKKCLQGEKLFIGSADPILGLFLTLTKNEFNSLFKLKNHDNKLLLSLASSTNCIKEVISGVILFQAEKPSENFSLNFQRSPLKIVFIFLSSLA